MGPDDVAQMAEWFEYQIEQIGLKEQSFINLSSSVKLVSIYDPLFRGE